MIERDLTAIMRGVTPVLREHFSALERRLVREVEQAEALRSAEHRALIAEHRAWMTEQRAAHDEQVRKIDNKLATVRDGRDGADGAPGRDGIDGINGRDGTDGAAGRDGADGVNGKDGVPGADGRDGIDGKDGLPGADGKDGEAGRDGLDGRDGTDGKDGRDGADGKDAYPGEARGLFDPNGSYRALDVVSFNGCEWRAKRDAPGELPGDGWMLSASRGKRGDRGERGPAGKDGSTVIAFYRDPGSMNLVLTKDDGTELKADLADLTHEFGGR